MNLLIQNKNKKNISKTFNKNKKMTKLYMTTTEINSTGNINI